MSCIRQVLGELSGLHWAGIGFAALGRKVLGKLHWAGRYWKILYNREQYTMNSRESSHGLVIRAQDLQLAGPGFKSDKNHWW